jgi:hypothetical protein
MRFLQSVLARLSHPDGDAEANFTATCIPPLNRFPTSGRPRGSGRRAARRMSNTSWRLKPPLRLDATRGSRMPATQTLLEEQPVKAVPMRARDDVVFPTVPARCRIPLVPLRLAIVIAAWGT